MCRDVQDTFDLCIEHLALDFDFYLLGAMFNASLVCRDLVAVLVPSLFRDFRVFDGFLELRNFFQCGLSVALKVRLFDATTVLYRSYALV